MPETTEMDAVHGALLAAHSAGLTLKDVLSCLGEMPEILTGDDFGAAVSALIAMRGCTGD